MGTKVLNTDDIQGVFVAADEATELAARAAKPKVSVYELLEHISSLSL